MSQAPIRDHGVIQDSITFTLELSQDGFQLYQHYREEKDLIDLYSAPTNLREALNYDEFEEKLEQLRPVRHRRATRVQHKYLRRFFLELDHSLCDYLRESNAWLYVTGPSDMVELYRQISRYPYLTNEESFQTPYPLT